jgi:ubiquinone/menaquinone biosynthesis C-methylase UbiE
VSFDRIAPHYRWLERLFAGDRLQRARTACFPAEAPRRILSLGEGHGRTLAALRAAYPAAAITCVDASAGMLARARAQDGEGNVEFIHADALTWPVPAGEFDLLVTHFFLDCFPPEQLAVLIPRLATAAAPGAQWLIADFYEPARGLARWRARIILKILYAGFRIVTRLPASRLTPPDPYLIASGFRLKERHHFEWALLHSDRWVREPEASLKI